MFETEIHRVYTEETSPEIDGKYPYFIACQEGEGKAMVWEDETIRELILTTIDSNVTCPLCIEAFSN